MNTKLMRLLAVLLAFTLIAAACGDDDDDSSTATTEDDGGSSLADDGEPEPEPEPEPESDDDGEMAEDDGEMAEDEGAEDDGVAALPEPCKDTCTVSDAIQGDGAELWEQLTDNPVGPADDSLEPVVVTMANLEGSPAGSFPEIREGLLAAAKNINENLGGVNGRPIEVDVCVHGLDPAEATNCANEIADTAPNLHIHGIDFFNPLMWPTIAGAGIPVLQTVPIFVSDFNTVGLISTEGGCVTAFPGGAQYSVEVLESDAVAVIHSDTGPGLECFADTQARFFEQLETERPGEFIWQGFPDASGDPTDNDAIVQNVIEFFEGASNPSVYFGIQASDCNEILSALSSAGVTATVVASGACRDDSVLANPASVGVHFGGTDRIPDREDLWTPYQTKNNAIRQAAIDAFGPEAPQSAFMEVSHDVMMSAWVAFLLMEEQGISVDDSPAVIDYFVTADNMFRVGGVAGQNCTTNTSEFVSVCQKALNFYTWSGPGGQFDFGPAGEAGIDVTDILVRTGEGNPREG
jgi:hypothetical protein